MTPEQIARIEEVVKQWHEAGRLRFEADYRHLDYDSPRYAKHYHVGAKYIRLDAGDSGAFMAEIESGIIYEIQGYGTPNKKKIAGVIWDPEFSGAQLDVCRYVRGSYDYRTHATTRNDLPR